MKTSDLLRRFKSISPELQELIEAVAEHAYAQGRRDQSAEMTQIALEADRRVQRILHGLPNVVEADSLH